MRQPDFEHDPFIDDLDGLNYEEMGIADVAAFAKALARPLLTEIKPPENVYYIEDYRHGNDAA